MNRAAPRRGLVETRLLIEIRAGDPNAYEFAIEMLRAAGIEVSELSATCLIAQARTVEERHRNLAFLSNCTVHAVSARVSHRAYRIAASVPLPASLTADDALVAATALIHKLPLYTLDPARFAAVPGLTALRPY